MTLRCLLNPWRFSHRFYQHHHQVLYCLRFSLCCCHDASLFHYWIAGQYPPRTAWHFSRIFSGIWQRVNPLWQRTRPHHFQRRIRFIEGLVERWCRDRIDDISHSYDARHLVVENAWLVFVIKVYKKAAPALTGAAYGL